MCDLCDAAFLAHLQCTLTQKRVATGYINKTWGCGKQDGPRTLNDAFFQEIVRQLIVANCKHAGKPNPYAKRGKGNDKVKAKAKSEADRLAEQQLHDQTVGVDLPKHQATLETYSIKVRLSRIATNSPVRNVR